MEQPYPMEFVDEGDVIVMRLEEYDTVRRILMSADAQAQAPAPGILGRSVGRWDDDVLVVETSGIDYPWLNGRGIPLSEHARIQERFEVSEDGSRLQYAMKFTDPLVFTEIVTFTVVDSLGPGSASARQTVDVHNIAIASVTPATNHISDRIRIVTIETLQLLGAPAGPRHRTP